MDKIDEWMNRAFDGKNPQNARNATPQSGVPKSHPQSQPKPFSQKAKQQNRNFNNRRPMQKPLPPKQSPQPMKQQQSRPQQQPRPTQQKQQPHQQQPRPTQQKQQPHQQNQPRGHQNSRRAPAKRIPARQPRPGTPHRISPILPGKLKIIPLGGLNEVGKNIMVYEYEEDIIIVDMGLEFPSEDLMGIDYVIPDVSYLEDNKKRIKGVVITHGHLDHIGGIPYILPKLDFPPVFATRLTAGLIEKRLEEFGQERLARLHVIDPDKPLRLGKFLCNFFRVAHSIPDAVGVIIETPVGKIVHTGDFKFDDTPSGGQRQADMNKIRALGTQNVLALLSDSTNALKPGHTMSEKQVGETLEKIIKETTGRLIVTSFSSLIGRIQQIVDFAKKHNRKIFISGRSMKDNIDIAVRLGYLNIPKGLAQDIKKGKSVPDRETLILTTGSQGEPMSALSRISINEHPQIKIKKGDTVVISASPIIGNERAIHTVINNLSLLGAKVVYSQIMDIHTSGHAYQQELKQMLDFVKPKYFLPVHGEYYMRLAHAHLANEQCGITEDRIIMLQNGDILHAERNRMYLTNEKLETKFILIDGLGQGEKDSFVQLEREIMSENGVLVILVHVSKKGKKLKKTPDIVSRGYVYTHETDMISAEISGLAGKAYVRIMEKNPGASRSEIKKFIRQTVDQYTQNKLERRPLIVPLIIED